MPRRPLSWLAKSAVALCACARADRAPQALAPVDPAELRPTSGTLERTSASTFTIEDPSFRAELGDTPRDSAEIAFVYRGPTRRDAPLASGELRRQIGLKLRAKDTCNVVYVMWHIEPSRGIEVSVKSNPGQATHEECGDRGYTFIKSAWVGDDTSEIRTGDRHDISATIAGATLRVVADGRPAWVGDLPLQAFQANGPVGVRTDNGVFEVELRVSAAGAGPR